MNKFCSKRLNKSFLILFFRGEAKSIIPPYFELDRSDTSVSNRSSTFDVEALDSYYSLNATSPGFPYDKKNALYGVTACILAQSICLLLLWKKQVTH
jgi:hypothetical protein